MKKIFFTLMVISSIIGVGFTLIGFSYKNTVFHGLIIVGICILLGIAVKTMDQLIDEIKVRSYRIWIVPLAIFIPTAMTYLALTEEPVIGMVIGTVIGILIAGKLDHPAYILSVILFITLVLIAFALQVINIEATTLYIIPVAATGSFLDEFGHEKWKSNKKSITFVFKHRFFLKTFAFFGVILGFAQPIHLIGFLCFDIFYDLTETASRHDIINKKSIQNSSQAGLNKWLTMFDPLVKKIAKWYSKKCPTCGITRIEAVLNNFKEEIICPECKKHLTFGSIMLKTLMMYMKMNSNELIDLSSDKETMATINALFRSIGKQGQVTIEIGIPIYSVFDITDRCNLSCIHCYSSEKKGELTTTDVYHVLDMLYEAGVGIIDFGGGEPLLRKDIFDILSYSKQLGLYTSISTNGTLLDSNCVKQLKTLDIDHVCISLDGAKPETHDHIRNKKGTYKKTINGIKNCVSASINTQISTVFMKNNINELVDIYNLLDSLNVDGWYIYDFAPAGRGKELQQDVLTPEQRKRLFEYLQGIAPSSKMTLKPYPYLITINSACGTDTYFYKKYGRLTEFFKGCLSARWVCYISSNGDLHPCHLLPHKLGNLKQETFEDIWFNKNNAVLRELRDRTLLKGNCGKCKYRDVCGGCRAQAFWKTGDYLESDRCWIKN